MTEADKREIASIIRDELRECGGCSLGITKATASELISFADTWKTCRRYAIGAVVTVAIGGILAALWAGLKALLTMNAK